MGDGRERTGALMRSSAEMEVAMCPNCVRVMDLLMFPLKMATITKETEKWYGHAGWSNIRADARGAWGGSALLIALSPVWGVIFTGLTVLPLHALAGLQVANVPAAPITCSPTVPSAAKQKAPAPPWLLAITGMLTTVADRTAAALKASLLVGCGLVGSTVGATTPVATAAGETTVAVNGTHTNLRAAIYPT